MKLLGKACLGLLLLGATTVQAQLVEADWLVSGDNKAVYDEQTQLTWLDLDMTRNMSYINAINALATNQDFVDYRLPTASEVQALYNHAFLGAPMSGTGYTDYFSGVTFDAARQFGQLFQSNSQTSQWKNFNYGLYDRTGTDVDTGNVSMMGVLDSDTIIRVFDPNWFSPYSTTTGGYTLSVYLVKDPVVNGGSSGSETTQPVTSWGSFMSLPLMGLFFLRKRKPIK